LLLRSLSTTSVCYIFHSSTTLHLHFLPYLPLYYLPFATFYLKLSFLSLSPHSSSQFLPYSFLQTHKIFGDKLENCERAMKNFANNIKNMAIIHSPDMHVPSFIFYLVLPDPPFKLKILLFQDILTVERSTQIDQENGLCGKI